MINCQIDLMKYTGVASQLLISLGIAVYAGLWLDKQFIHSVPLLVWILPMLVLVGNLIKLIKDTSK